MSIVIPRSVWKPRYSNGVEVIGTHEWLNAGKELWLHHSITTPFGPDATLAQDCEHMRTFEAIGQNRYGAGISYTWVVMPSARVFAGHDIDRQGTHTYQRNNRSRAICLAGNFDVNGLPPRMERAVAALLRELGATLDGGHRDVYATACPGRHAYARIPEINRLASSGAPIELEDEVTAYDNWHNIRFGANPSYEATPAMWLLGTNDHAHAIRYTEMPALRAVTAQILAAVTEDSAITPEFIETTVNEATAAAAREQAPAVAALINAELVDVVYDALRQVQDADNLDEAKRTVDELVRRIGTLTAPPAA